MFITFFTWITLFTVLLQHLSCGLLDALIEKDLYKDLGLKSNASIKEIKKAFRQLATKHHPDKSSLKDKEINKAIFHDIAQAYEVLSNQDQKQEYDDMRQMGSQRSSYNNNQQNRGSSRKYEQHRQQDYEDHYSAFFSFDEWVEEAENIQEQEAHFSSRYRPIISGPILPARQIIFPYQPIMVSEDNSYFALLDIHCSFGVYKGDIDILIRHLLVADEAPDLTMMPLELKFRTEGDPSLKGECFAGLDEEGTLKVYAGSPDYPERSRPIWSSNPPTKEIYRSYFTRFYVELSMSGELAVRMLEAGNSESQCVWSTTSCNKYVALLKDVKGHVVETLISVQQDLKDLLQWIKSKTAVIHEQFIDKQKWSSVFKITREKIQKKAMKFWTYSKEAFHLKNRKKDSRDYRNIKDNKNFSKNNKKSESSSGSNDIKYSSESSGANRRNRRRNPENS